MTSAHRRLVDTLIAWTGIDLERGGRTAAVDHFIENRARALRLSPEAYVDSLKGPDHPEIKELIEAFTVGHTWFYRDPEQLELISRLVETELHDEQPVQVWVPGCATGEDVYTLAMLAARTGWRGSFLGTDINPGFVARAQVARYSEWTLRRLPAELQVHLVRVGDGLFQVTDRIRSVVRFQQHNLLDAPPKPPAGAWHIILCRNVLIYFRHAQSLAAVEQLGRALASHGWLFLGASDGILTNLSGVRQMTLEGRSALRRKSGRWGASRPAVPGAEPARPTVVTLPSAVSPVGATPQPEVARDALLVRGVAALESGRTQAALVDLIKAIEIDALCGEAHLFAGLAYHLAGDVPSAIQALRAAILLEPDLWLASFYLALNYEKMGQANEASREFRNVGRALARPAAMRRGTMLSDKLAIWEHDIAALARSRVR
jgi:chemotaxis protein methyltransferase CheR